MQFIGRKQQVASLEALLVKKSASLVVLTGRRRIGKSRLIQEFGKGRRFIRLSGIAPTKQTTAQSQRDLFAQQLSSEIQSAAVTAYDWQTLFGLLADYVETGQVIVLLDEISWMGSKDPNFLGLLKDAWDDRFSKNSQLVMVLCGSVSSWIEREIINSTAFLGRPALYITLQELNLEELNLFWQQNKFDHFSAYEKLKILAIIGGVPRYLELLNPQETAQNNIQQLCFQPSSPILGEYDRIFSDIFGLRSPIYKKIIASIFNHSQQQADILQALDRKKSGTVSEYFSDLIQAGFISRDFNWNFMNGKQVKHSRYRIKDNFIRFYLKFIEPNQRKIEEGLMIDENLSNLPGWYTTLGLQFENLVLNNIKSILQMLTIKPSEVINFGPYFQVKTKQAAGCQIDLLIQTKMNLLFLCEIKFSRHPVSAEVIQEMQSKLQHLQKPKGLSCLPVLIHVNGVSDQVLDAGFFYRIIDFGDFFKF